MIEGVLSRRYSKALFQLAGEAGQEEEVGREIEQFLVAYSSSDLHMILINPAFGVDTRKRIVIQVANRQRLSRLTINFLSLLLERDRFGDLAGIVACYRRLLNASQGRVEAEVTSATPLEPSLVDQLRHALMQISGKKVVLQESTDAALIGGVKVEVEGTVYDGSVRTQLEKMKQRVTREI